MAAKPANPTGARGRGPGGTFAAWGPFWPEGQEPVPEWNPYGSYGVNDCVAHRRLSDNDDCLGARVWRTADVSGTDRIPVYFDHSSSMVDAVVWGEVEVEPPACDAIPAALEPTAYWVPCINRHDGGINAVFLDWSVRKVGLKELWTLKWNRQYNTSGRWTKAGGVQPEDWPQWMRGFKDY